MAVDVIVAKAEGFGYAGRFVFNGEIIALGGHPNDGKLLNELKYFTRYTDSPHDKSDEVYVHGRRFISQYHSHSYLRTVAEEEEKARERRDYLTTDPQQIETVALESRGLTVHENRDPHKGISISGVDLPTLQKCPIEGCSEQITVEELHDHVQGHASDIKPAAKPKAAKPKAKAVKAEVVSTKPATRTRAAKPKPEVAEPKAPTRRRRAPAASGK